MTATFSWSDPFHLALASCLPCLSPSSPSSPPPPLPLDSDDPLLHANTHPTIPRARPDELQGLLADPDSTDTEAERMSMHSNPGSASRRRQGRSKRKHLNHNHHNQRKNKRITLFGYDLFGRPAIYLPESDDDEGAPRAPKLSTRSSSSMTFDSDAAPLDTSTIESISASTAAAAAAREEEELRHKAERRERRRERKEMRRVAKMLAAEAGAGAEEAFEGFQGSGDVPHMPASPEFGPFVQARPRPPPRAMATTDDTDLGDDADLDGGAYAQTRRELGLHPGSSAGSRSRSRSDSRSRTSASRSDVVPPSFAHQARPDTKPKSKSNSTTTPSLSSSSASAAPRPRPKSKKTRSSASRSTTSAATSQSASLPSPTSTSFPPFAPFLPHAVITETEFDGSQGLTIDDLPSAFINESQAGLFPGVGGDGGGGGGGGGGEFPSTGFGRPREGKGKESRGGAFLATRGDLVDG